MAELTLDVLTPTGAIDSARSVSVDGVEVPGLLGELGILPGHIPFVSAIVPGVVRFKGENGQAVRLAVGAGFVEVSGEGRVSVLTERAVTTEEIDAESVRSELKSASEDLAKRSDAIDSAEHQKLADRAKWLSAQMQVISN